MVNKIVTLPSDVPGVVWRPLSDRDAAPLYDLLDEVDDKERTAYRTSMKEIKDMLARDEGWVGVAGYQEDSPEAKMIAFGYVGVSRVGLREGLCEGSVHPSLRGEGIGRALLSWQTNCGARLLTRKFPGKTSHLVHSVSEKHPLLQEAIKELGYRWANSYAELRLRIDDIPPKSKLPAMYHIERWTEDKDNLARRAYNEASSQIGTDAYLSSKEWKELIDQAQRDWSFLAVDRTGDRPKVVGFITVGAYEQDWEFLGWKEGVVELVAVFDTARRDEILLALVRSTMKALKKAEMDRVCVSLDPVENQDMLQFYVSLGFDVGSWYYTYRYKVKDKA